MVAAHLAAAVGVGEGVEAVDAALDQVLVFLHHSRGNAVDAADGGDDPQLVSDGGAAVLTAVAHEGSRADRGLVVDLMAIGVFRRLAQAGADVVDVRPCARGDLRLRDADGVAVLDDRLPLGNPAQSDLVPARDILCGGDGDSVQFQYVALTDILQDHGDIVVGVDADCFHLRHSLVL